MIRPVLVPILLLALGISTRAQAPLSLDDARARARKANLAIHAAAAAERQAQAGIAEARAVYLPSVDLSEGWQRGDQPVFVFSSLLAQRTFTSSHFAIDALNRPAATDNFRAALIVEQPLLAPTAPAEMRLARLGRESAALSRTRVDQDVTVAVTEAYGRVLAAAAARRTTAAALAAAQEARALAANRRDAGLATDADVLQVDVHLARVAERGIQAGADERIARAELNHLMGEPLDAIFALDPTPPAAVVFTGEAAAPDAGMIESRPDVALAAVNHRMAEAARDRVRASFLPRVVAQAGWEANGGSWGDRSSSWIVGAEVRMNLFRGLGDRARLAAAREDVARHDIERDNVRAMAELDVRRAAARLDAARARLAAGRAAVEQSRESHRIIRDRYEGGLTDVASLLRASEMVEEAEQIRVEAEVGLLTRAAELDRALGKR